MRRQGALEPHTIAVVVFDRLSVFHLAVPAVVFGEDRTDVGVPAFKLRLCAAEPGVLRASIGMDLKAPFGLAGLRGAGTVIVPSWRDTDERPPQALLTALQRAHAAGARIVGLCLGAFVLAEAGLLDGRSATTHWGMSARFAQRFPAVLLKSDVLYVDEGDVITSAGTAAGLDCCLHLLRRDFGAEIANRVARRIVLAPHRQGGQAQYVDQTVPATGADHRLSALLDWLSRHLDQAHDLDALAARAAMGRRTFTRHFRQTTGSTVGNWLLNQRLAKAQRLLETTDQSMDRIAQASGLGSAMSLRQHFGAAFDVSPSAYRRQFRQR
jgi:transcriptional regulator GlxA family with amidase domain